MGSGIIWQWILFGVIVAVFLTVDLLLHRGKHGGSRKAAIVWSIVTISLGLGFTIYVWFTMGGSAAQEYLAAYLLEESLSLDNLFVFLIIFRMMKIPIAQQGVALTWGILGALVLRGLFIFVGAEVLERWGWVEYILAALLMLAAWRAYREKPRESEKKNKLVAWLQRHLPVTEHREDAKFLVREGGHWKTTPLFVAVIGLELSDVMFAIDSVPAVFSITRDTFLVYTSNVFAILGLRSLYVVVAHTIAGLRYLHYGLAMVLAFAALKILLGRWNIDIAPLVSVGVTVFVIGASIVASLVGRKRDDKVASPDAVEEASR